MDLELSQSDRIADTRRILADALREVDELGKYVSAFEYKMTYYQESLSVGELREWVNWLNALRNQISDAMEVLSE